MNVASGPELAAAVTNAGGLGVLGGVKYTPKVLRRLLDELKGLLDDPSAPFGVDLLIPKTGEGARKTNYDYAGGELRALIDIIAESGAKLFVCAVGTPPVWAVERLHAAGVLVMNMVGAPKHVEKALAAGADLICAQGGEGGGHTGDIATSILIPACVDACQGRTSPLTGAPVRVVAAGGIFDARGLAMALSLGAIGAWVGTRFVASVEAGAPSKTKAALVNAGHHATRRTLVYSGRPMRVLNNAYVDECEGSRAAEVVDLLKRGVVPYENDIKSGSVRPAEVWPDISGACAGMIREVLPARRIVEEMAEGAAAILRRNASYLAVPAAAGQEEGDSEEGFRQLPGGTPSSASWASAAADGSDRPAPRSRL